MVEIISLLHKIGLTDAESKAYLALIRHGNMSGYEVSKMSGVARSKVYNVLETLITKGFIRFSKNEGGNQYGAVPIGEISERIQKETKETLEKLEQALSAYDTETDLDSIWHIRESKNVFAKCRNLIQNTKEELLLQVWKEDMPQIEKELLEAEQKGIRIGIVYFSEDEKEKLPFQHYSRHGMLTQKKEEMGGRFLTLVADKEKVVFGQILNEDTAEVLFTASKPMVGMAAECVRHDLYFYKNAGMFGEVMREELGDDYAKIREIF